MIERAITQIATVPAHEGAMPDALRAELSAHLPKLAIRKFSDSGLLMSRILHTLGASGDEPIVSASTFAESRSLEDFVDSFPTPSPARFQRSVHPSAIQQARVITNAPVGTFIPIAGQEGISVIAARTALTLDAPAVHLVASEECGTWSVGIHVGSATGFAFGLTIGEKVAGTEILGTIAWTPESVPDASGDTSLLSLHQAISERRSYRVGHPDIGTITILWK